MHRRGNLSSAPGQPARPDGANGCTMLVFFLNHGGAQETLLKHA